MKGYRVTCEGTSVETYYLRSEGELTKEEANQIIETGTVLPAVTEIVDVEVTEIEEVED